MSESLANLQKEGLEIYSTDEVVIGTYCGKPRYRKVIQTSISQMTSGASYQKSLDISTLGIEKPLKIDGVGKNYIVSPARWENLIQVYLLDNSLSASYSTNITFTATSIILTLGSAMQSRITGDLEFTIEYTKATD